MSSSNNSEHSVCDGIISALMEDDFLNGMMLDMMILKIHFFCREHIVAPHKFLKNMDYSRVKLN